MLGGIANAVVVPALAILPRHSTALVRGRWFRFPRKETLRKADATVRCSSSRPLLQIKRLLGSFRKNEVLLSKLMFTGEPHFVGWLESVPARTSGLFCDVRLLALAVDR